MKREAAKIVPKLVNFEQKQRRMNIAQEMFNDVQRRYRFAQEGDNWWRIMGVWLWHWNWSLIIPKRPTRRAKTEKSTSSYIKCAGFAHCFLRLQWRGASWILVPSSYWQCIDCANQFVRNAHNCRKTNHGFCTMITQLTHQCLCVSSKNKTVIMPPPQNLLDLARVEFFLFP